jgi:KaiC/GvpD/RAD55 family RecA-like ATPase
MEGGFLEGASDLVAGSTSTEKTTFRIQFLVTGLKSGNPAIYVTFEKTPKDIKRYNRRYGFDLGLYETKCLLNFVPQDPFDVSDLIPDLGKAVSSVCMKRLVLDPISATSMYVNDPVLSRKQQCELVRTVKAMGVTTLMAYEMPESEIGERRGSLSGTGWRSSSPTRSSRSISSASARALPGLS